MNKRERELLSGIYDRVQTIGTLTPRNPADTKAIFHNLPVATKGARAVARAISSLGFGDYEDCAEHLDDADLILSRRPSESEATHA